MVLTATSKGSGVDFEPVPSGLWPAVCVGVYDLGTHFNRPYQKSEHKCLLKWEIKGLMIEIEKDGQMQTLPRVISERYTLSTHPKSNLRPTLDSWRGKAMTDEEATAFDIIKVLGASCQLNITHGTGSTGKTYANVSAVVPAQSKVTPISQLQSFSFEDGGIIPEGISGWIVDIIKQSDEWQARLQESLRTNEHDQRTGPPGGFNDFNPPPGGTDQIPF